MSCIIYIYIIFCHTYLKMNFSQSEVPLTNDFLDQSTKKVKNRIDSNMEWVPSFRSYKNSLLSMPDRIALGFILDTLIDIDLPNLSVLKDLEFNEEENIFDSNDLNPLFVSFKQKLYSSWSNSNLIKVFGKRFGYQFLLYKLSQI